VENGPRCGAVFLSNHRTAQPPNGLTAQPPILCSPLLHFARANPIMAPHALAGRQIARVDDSDRDRAPPPRLCGADVPGDRHLRHRRPEDQSRSPARHPGYVLAVGRRLVHHSRLLLAHPCPPSAAGPDLPLSAGAVRCRPDYHGRPHDGRRGKRSRQPLRHLHRRHGAADAAGECRARHAVRRPGLLRRRLLGACGGHRRHLDPARGLHSRRSGDRLRRQPGERHGRGARSTGSRGAPGAARGGRRAAQPPDGRDHRGRGRPAAVRESGSGGDPRIPGARVAGAPRDAACG